MTDHKIVVQVLYHVVLVLECFKGSAFGSIYMSLVGEQGPRKGLGIPGSVSTQKAGT